jgi:hypothetical protein
VHVGGAATRSCITKVDSIGESAITTSVRLAARTGDGPEPMGPYPILTAMINRLSVSVQVFGRRDGGIILALR